MVVQINVCLEMCFYCNMPCTHRGGRGDHEQCVLGYTSLRFMQMVDTRDAEILFPTIRAHTAQGNIMRHSDEHGQLAVHSRYPQDSKPHSRICR